VDGVRIDKHDGARRDIVPVELAARLHGYGPKLTYQGSDTIGYADTRIRRRIRTPAVSVDFSFKKLIK
jgi:hypothetical protein